MIKYLLLILLLVLLIIILNKNSKNEKFTTQNCKNFSCVNDNCSITKETRNCKDGRKHINNIPNCYYDKVVDPNNLRCIDFCVKTYTWKDGTKDNTGGSIEKNFIDSKLHSYFSSKCNECIDTFYDRIKLLDIDD